MSGVRYNPDGPDDVRYSDISGAPTDAMTVHLPGAGRPNTRAAETTIAQITI